MNKHFQENIKVISKKVVDYQTTNEKKIINDM